MTGPEKTSTENSSALTSTVERSATGHPASLPSFAALKALPAPTERGATASVEVAGREGGTFRWVSESVKPADDVMCIRPPGISTPGRWERQYDSPVRSRWWGTRGDGSEVDVASLQGFLNWSWATLLHWNQGWVGVGDCSPVAILEPGRYRLDGTLTMGTNTSLSATAAPCNTNSHTRLIMDSSGTVAGGGKGDNRNKAILRFSRATPNRAALANEGLTVNVQNIEFWFVTMGNDFNNPLGGTGIPDNYPDGGCLLFDIPVLDSRLRDNVFQHSPAAIRIKGVSVGPGSWPDGFGGAPIVNYFSERNEFDAALRHIYATNSNLEIVHRGDQFYGAPSTFKACTGSVVFDAGCYWHGGAYVDASHTGNSFSLFKMHGTVRAPTERVFLYVYGAKRVDIDLAIYGATPFSTVVLVNCDGGRVNVNIVDSGYNSKPAEEPQSAAAAVKLLGCRGILVTGSIGVSDDALATRAAFNGYGVVTADNGARVSADNFVSGLMVTAPYNGASYRQQDRAINLAPGDVRGNNFNKHDGLGIQKHVVLPS